MFNILYSIQMMHGSEWTLKYDKPEVENVARGRSEAAHSSSYDNRSRCAIDATEVIEDT